MALWILSLLSQGLLDGGLFKLTLNMARGLIFIMSNNKPIKPIIFLKLSLYIHFIFYIGTHYTYYNENWHAHLYSYVTSLFAVILLGTYYL